ncbi:MAG: type I glyceraldehyde-3-phosphate dehydrogenase [Candidatus Adlerbacteria bacterium]|nr:type I glyceraldehyde-3-phosphate dehydrogenase [Candidatus Adlerbacteria bacterium]
MATKIAINGFGRIGRAFMRVVQEHPELEVVAINDLSDAENLAYLLTHDSVYGQATFPIATENGALVVGGTKIPVYAEADPSNLPWKDLGIDIVIESTGFFTSYEKAKVHIAAGAKRVVITAPVKDDAPEGLAGATILVGINDDKFETSIITSNASCTTNASSPLIQILNEAVGVEKAVLSTTHAYTASQNIVDGPVKKAKGKDDFRDGRAGADNIVPSSTGAAIAVTKALPELAGKFDGISLRVPVVAGSIADVTFIAKRPTSVEEINNILTNAAADERWKPVFAVTTEPLVSSDILGNAHASIADLSLTRVVDGNLVKVLAWYDNEMGYTHSLVEHVQRLAKHI